MQLQCCSAIGYSGSLGTYTEHRDRYIQIPIHIEQNFFFALAERNIYKIKNARLQVINYNYCCARSNLPLSRIENE